MRRPDITPDLVHFIKGDSEEESFATLQTILSDGALLGGTGFIRGEHRCVCFSEAPLAYLADGIKRRSSGGKRLQRFGVIVTKRWLYERGGRPVIYGPEVQYGELPAEHRWRHVRFEPCNATPIDFTWEREWRILVDNLPIAPSEIRVVVSSWAFARRLADLHDEEQQSYVQNYREAGYDQYPFEVVEFPWQIVVPLVSDS